MAKNRKISLVIFDWAGTAVDYGSQAPAKVFDLVLKSRGVVLSRAQINAPMGLEKRAHIRALLSLPSAAEQWQLKYGSNPCDEDVETLYQEFEAQLSEVVALYSTPLEGVIDTVQGLRDRGLKIGSTTGYNREIMNKVLPRAEALGYRPDCTVTPDETGLGRPSPFMIFECMKKLNVLCTADIVKVGDTLADIAEGKNAGVISVGVIKGSNLLGLTQKEFAQTEPKQLAKLKEECRDKYLKAGADYVLEDITELLPLIDILNEGR